MAADNAIIIGLIAANFAKDNRRKIIAWGVGAAFLFRIFFAEHVLWMQIRVTFAKSKLHNHSVGSYKRLRESFGTIFRGRAGTVIYNVKINQY